LNFEGTFLIKLGLTLVASYSAQFPSPFQTKVFTQIRKLVGLAAKIFLPSFPRRREPSVVRWATLLYLKSHGFNQTTLLLNQRHWIPACAGMTIK
jgi:hypothetical protein